MAESLFRSGRRRGFAVVYREVAQDQRLSLKARGLFLLLQSLPETWQYTISGLATLAGTGKDQIRSALSELLAVGYLVKEQSHDPGGKFSGNIFILQEEAPLSENPTTVEAEKAPLSGKPITGKPTTGKPSTENPTLRKEEYKRIRNKTPKAPTPSFVWDCVENFLGDDPEYFAAFEGLLKIREALGEPVLTTRSINTIINRLRPVSREVGIAMLDKATNCNWLTVYPLRPDELPAEEGEEDAGTDPWDAVSVDGAEGGGRAC